MNYFLFGLVVPGAGFLLLHYLLIPRLRRGVEQANVTVESVSRRAVLAVLEFARTFLAMAVGTYFGFLLLLGGLYLTGSGMSLLNMGVLSDLLQASYLFWDGLGDWWARGSIALLVIALGGLTYFHRRRVLSGQLDALREEDFQKLLTKHEAGELPELPPNSRMAPFAARITELDRYAETVTDEEHLKEVAEARQELVNAYIILDLDRRIEISPDRLQVEAPIEPRDLKEKIGVFFMSEGLLGTLRGGSSLIMKGGMVLLLLSVLGYQGSSQSGMFQDAIVSLEKLEIETSQENADAAWAAASGPGPGAGESAEEVALSEEDEALIDELGATYEDIIIEEICQIDSRCSLPRQSAQTIRSARVAHQILTVTRRASPHTARLTTHGLPETEAPRLRQHYETPRGKPRSTLGKAFVARLKQDIKNHPRLWPRIRQDIRTKLASFQRPARFSQATGALVNELIGRSVVTVDDSFFQLAGDAPEKSVNLLGKIVSEGAEDSIANVGEKTARRLHRFTEMQYKNFVGGLADPEFVPSSMVSIRSDDIEFLNDRMRALPDADDTLKLFQQHRPSLSINELDDVRKAKATKLIDKMIKTQIRFNGGGSGARFVGSADALASFDDWFPGQARVARQTARFEALDAIQLAEHIAPGGGRSSGGRNLVGQARNFRGLRGFARVGGVLIGQSESAGTSDVRDIQWQRTRAGMELQLTTADGRTQSFGPYHPSLVHQSLAYAADGRPLAVTMTKAQPLGDLRVLIHPVLADTALGCHLTELDRYVDTAVGMAADIQERGGQLGAAERRTLDELRFTQLQQTLFGIAHTIRLEHVQGETSSFGTEVETHERIMEIVAQTRELSTNRGLPLLESKSEFFDQELVQGLLTCMEAKNQSDFAKFRACIQSETSSSLSWAQKEAPDAQVWSGVREVPFERDPELKFLRAEPTEDAPLNPLTFIEQVAFGSAPEFGAAADTENYVDETPFEFPEVKKDIVRMLESFVDYRPDHRRTYDIARDFTVLQRMFRSALGGQMGAEFPVEKLVQLSDASSGAVRAQATPRWTPKPWALPTEYAERMTRLGSTLIEMRDLEMNGATRRVFNRMATCVNQFAARGGQPLLRVPGHCVFTRDLPGLQKTCELSGNQESAACRLALNAEFLQLTLDAIQLRRELAVDRESGASRTVCRPL